MLCSKFLILYNYCPYYRLQITQEAKYGTIKWYLTSKTNELCLKTGKKELNYLNLVSSG